VEESGFEWMAEMRDGISGPALEARRSLAALRGETVAADASLRRLQATQAGFERRRWGPLAESGDIFQGAGARLTSMFGPVALAVLAFREVKDAIEAATGALYDFITEGAKMAILAVQTRQHMLRAFTAGDDGDADLGQRTYDMAQRLRRELPQSEKEIADWTSALQGVGLVDPGKIAQVEKAMAAASALYGGGAKGDAAAGKVEGLIAKALEQDAFKTRGGLKAFVGTGISADDLSKALGMTPAQLNQAFTKGTIPVEKGMQAITDILTRKGAKAIDGTLQEWDVIMSKGKESVSHLFEDVDTGGFMAMLADFGTSLDKDQTVGRGLKTIFTDLFNNVFGEGKDVLEIIIEDFLLLELISLKIDRHWKDIVDTVKKVTTATILPGAKPGSPSSDKLGAVAGDVLSDAFNPLALPMHLLGFGRKSRTPLGPNALNMPEQTIAAAGPNALNTPEQTIAAAHADGGLVARPAPGEFFASVAPGETILPADQSRAASAPQLRGDDDGGAAHLEQHVELHYHGVKDAEETRRITTDELADLLERAAAEMAR
jgi:hypothetical protein